MKLTTWIKSLFRATDGPDTAPWAADFAAGPAVPALPPQYACALACCPSTAGLAAEDPEAFDGPYWGGQGA